MASAAEREPERNQNLSSTVISEIEEILRKNPLPDDPTPAGSLTPVVYLSPGRRKFLQMTGVLITGYVIGQVPFTKIVNRCSTGDGFTSEHAKRFAQDGQWRDAAFKAQQVLTDPSLCAEDKEKLGALFIKSKFEALYETKTQLDNPLTQEDAVKEYQSIRRLKDTYQIADSAFPSAWEIAKRAAQSKKYLLAKAVFDEPSVIRNILPQDEDKLTVVYNAWRNLGNYWAKLDDPQYKTEGLRLLGTANALEKMYHIHAAEDAKRDIQSLVGTDPLKMPTPMSHPLLHKNY